MSSVQEFIKNLTDSGMMSEDELKGILDTVMAESASAQGAAGVDALARELIRRQKITEYQADLLASGGEGLTLGSYVILDEIGSGGMGRVYKAQHRRMKRTVALKVLSEALRSPRAVQRFQREVEAAAKLNHPNIVAAYDADEENGVHYLVMEYVDGTSLADYIGLNGPLPVATTLDYILQAAYALRYAHQQGVVHRDIKPANLLLTSAGVVKVLDMGLARVDDEGGLLNEPGGHKLTQAGQIIGTIDFMPPEQAEDSRQADARSDIYALGCTLYFLLTGVHPYHGDTPMRRLLAHRDQPIPTLRAKRTDVPEELDAIFCRMVAKRPEDRFASMAEVVDALESCGTLPTLGPAAGILKHAFGSGLTTHDPAAETREMTPDQLATEPRASAPGPMLKEAAEVLQESKSPPSEDEAIRLACDCGHRFAVKPFYAGKRVRCPRCKQPLSVPKNDDSASGSASIAAQCKNCGKRLLVSGRLAGKTVKCTACAARVRIPSLGASDSAEKRDISCACGKRLRVGIRLAGKAVRCPVCGETVKVPA